MPILGTLSEWISAVTSVNSLSHCQRSSFSLRLSCGTRQSVRIERSKPSTAEKAYWESKSELASFKTADREVPILQITTYYRSEEKYSSFCLRWRFYNHIEHDFVLDIIHVWDDRNVIRWYGICSRLCLFKALTKMNFIIITVGGK